ncbi:MAG: chemotaxis protein CheW, partial [Oscillospiraceae bacterium]
SIKQSFKISKDTPVVYDPDGREMIMVRGECYRVMRLHQLFDVETNVTDLSEGIVILIESDKQLACIFADELLGEQQVVVKPFPIFLARHDLKKKGMAGCTILGDGSISLILDANSLLEQ